MPENDRKSRLVGGRRDGRGGFRFLVEFVREPDRQIGYLAFDWFTMGQALSLPMIIGGGGLMWWAYRQIDNMANKN